MQPIGSCERNFCKEDKAWLEMMKDKRKEDTHILLSSDTFFCLGASNVDVSGANIQLRRHHAADAGRSKKLPQSG